MNNVVGNYSFTTNYQQPTFKGYKEAPQKIIKNPKLIKAISDTSVEIFWKRVRRIPLEIAMFNIGKGLFAIEKGVKKVCNVFKK